MSEDLIKRNSAMATVGRMYEVCTTGDITDYRDLMLEAVKVLPSADRPPGEWIDRGEYAECSICGAHSGTQYDGVEPIPLKTNFCPNCGVQMKGVDDEMS